MAHYLVTMDLPEGEPNGPLPAFEALVGTIRETILPSLEALIALKAQGKVLAGGTRAGPLLGLSCHGGGPVARPRGFLRLVSRSPPGLAPGA